MLSHLATSFVLEGGQEDARVLDLLSMSSI